MTVHINRLVLFVFLFIVCCSGIDGNQNGKMTEAEILQELDLAFKGTPGKYFPQGRAQDIRYHFFPDLENGYFVGAGNRIHLYADSMRWAIVFEQNGYHNRQIAANVDLVYFGNCIDYPVNKYPERNYISNSSSITLIEPDEFQRIENKDGKEMENFELIGQNINEIRIRDKFVPFDADHSKCEKADITVREFENPKRLVGFDDYIRYLHETDPAVISATEEEIRQHLPADLPKLTTINEFHFISAYKSDILPSRQETYQLIAKVLVTGDPSAWKPIEKPNNHWMNWKSGNL